MKMKRTLVISALAFFYGSSATGLVLGQAQLLSVLPGDTAIVPGVEVELDSLPQQGALVISSKENQRVILLPDGRLLIEKDGNFRILDLSIDVDRLQDSEEEGWDDCEAWPRNIEEDRKDGYWAGFSFSGVGLVAGNPFQVGTDAPNTAEAESLGIETNNAFRSKRLEFNFAEQRWSTPGARLGITTGLGIDWWRVQVNPDQVLSLRATDNVIVAQASTDEKVLANRLDWGHVRMPLLLSVRTHTAAEEGLHLEAGMVLGARVFGQYHREVENAGEDAETTVRNWNWNPFQVQSRVCLGFGNFSLVAEFPLTDWFIDTPNLAGYRTFSVGAHAAF
jgi:hypothetical protein